MFTCDDGEAIVSIKSNEKKVENMIENVDNELVSTSKLQVEMDHRNFIRIQVNSCCLAALVDSGADECTVSKGLLRHVFGKGICPTIFNSPFEHVVLADGKKKIRVLGRTFLNVVIKNEKFRVCFHIKDTPCQSIILGNSFLKRQSAVMSFASSILEIKPMSRIFSSENIVIEPFGEIHTLARVDLLLPDGTEGVVDQAVDTFLDHNSLTVIRSLSRVWKGKIAVCIVNNQNVSVKVRKGCFLGRFLVLGEDFEVEEIRLNSMKHERVVERVVDKDGFPFLKHFQLPKDRLSESQHEQVEGLITEYADIFYEFKGKMGHYTGDTISIEVDKSAKPVKKSPYRVHPKYSQKLDEEINLLLDQGVVEESYGDWSSPALVVPKPGRPDEIRLVVDYRAVNKLVQKDAHPLPRMDDAFINVACKKPQFFSSLDLQSGYFQIDLDPESRQYTAFCTPHHSLRFTRVPQGLCISGQRFQRCMNRVFKGCINRFVVVYLDDILIYSQTFEQHLSHLREVFERLRDANLKLKAMKCQLLAESVKFLGHLLTKDGLATDRKLCEAVQNCPVPGSLTAVRSFVGLSSFYRRFIPGYGQVARPLYDLTMKDQKFKWSRECQMAFESLKKALCSPPVLAHPDFEKDFKLYTDSSQFAAGFCLAQNDANGKERVIAYGGRTYLNYQRNYSITEKEMLAVYLGVMHFDFYLRHSKFEIITDHSALTSLLTKQHEIKGKFARWATELMAYNFTIRYKEGKKLLNADALSRMTHHEVLKNETVDEMSGEEIVVNHEKCVKEPHILELINESVTDTSMTVEECVRMLKADKHVSVLYRLSEGSVNKDNSELFFSYGVLLADFFIDSHGVMWYKNHTIQKDGRITEPRLVVPGEIAKKILFTYHNGVMGGHFGVDKTMALITVKYFWPYMLTDIAEYIDMCELCQQFKLGVGVKNVPLGEKAEPYVGELVVLDMCGPLKETKAGNVHILCMMDYASRFIKLVPMKDSSAASVGTVFHDEWICMMGAPAKINSDRGPAFVSLLMQFISKNYGSLQSFSCPYVPRSHGLIERAQNTLV